MKKYLTYLSKGMSDNPMILLWVILSIVSLGGLIEIPYSIEIVAPRWLLWADVAFVSMFKGTLLTCLIVLAKRNIWTKTVMSILTGLYIIFCLVNFFCYFLYGFGISHRLIIILMQTTRREILEFIPGLQENIFTLRFIASMACLTIAIWAIYLGIMIGIKRLGKRFFLSLMGVTASVGIIAITISFATFKSRAALLMCVRIPKNIVNIIQETREYQKIADFKRPLPDADKVISSDEPITIVMVVGESAHRRHHQIYGYPLTTTPELMAVRDSLFIFKDAIGSSQGTAGNMERILTLKTDDGTCGDWYKFPLIYDIFNAAGFRTYWLSNQERRGLVSNASGVMAENADVVKYVSIESSEDAYAYRYDDVLLPHIKYAIEDKSKSKFIGVHLLGSHVEYQCRYPREETIFTTEDILKTTPKPWLNREKAETIAEYDNSIHFTDKLLGEVIRMCSSATTPIILLYFSDHGEMVYDNEDFKGRSEKAVEVPFIIYANKSCRVEYPEIMQRISKATTLPVSTANIPMSLLTIAGIQYPKYDASYDFLSPDYKIRPRMVDEEIWKYDK